MQPFLILFMTTTVGGSATGAFAAAVTTPLDVVKTRLMLGKDAQGVAYEGATIKINNTVLVRVFICTV